MRCQAEEEEEGGGTLVDFSCQLFPPMRALLNAAGAALTNPQRSPDKGRPPDFYRLKCKPVSCAFRKQKENLVTLVHFRTGRFIFLFIFIFLP